MIYENEILQRIEPQLAENLRRYLTTRNAEEIYQIQNAFGVFGYFFTETEIALILTLQPETCNDAKQLIPTLVQEGRQIDEEELYNLVDFAAHIQDKIDQQKQMQAARVAAQWERQERYWAAQEAKKQARDEQQEERRETYHESWFPEPEAEA